MKLPTIKNYPNYRENLKKRSPQNQKNINKQKNLKTLKTKQKTKKSVVLVVFVGASKCFPNIIERHRKKCSITNDHTNSDCHTHTHTHIYI